MSGGHTSEADTQGEDEASVILALAAIETPLTPESLLELCAIVHGHPAVSVREAAGEFWQMHVPREFQTSVRDILGSAFHEEFDFRATERLRALADALDRNAGIDVVALANRLYSLSGRGLAFILEHGGPISRHYLAQMIDADGVLQLGRSEGDEEGLVLGRLPPDAPYIAGVKALNLRGCELVTLPPGLANMSSLTGLDLSFSKFSELPGVVLELKRLEELRLDGRNLSGLPDAIGQLQALRVLSLREQPITTLPFAGLGTLAKLELIDLRRSAVATDTSMREKLRRACSNAELRY